MFFLFKHHLFSEDLQGQKHLYKYLLTFTNTQCLLTSSLWFESLRQAFRLYESENEPLEASKLPITCTSVIVKQIPKSTFWRLVFSHSWIRMHLQLDCRDEFGHTYVKPFSKMFGGSLNLEHTLYLEAKLWLIMQSDWNGDESLMPTIMLLETSAIAAQATGYAAQVLGFVWDIRVARHYHPWKHQKYPYSQMKVTHNMRK